MELRKKIPAGFLPGSITGLKNQPICSSIFLAIMFFGMAPTI